jgi:hypothetical protein
VSTTPTTSLDTHVAFTLEQSSGVSPTTRVTYRLHGSSLHGTGPDETSAMEDLLDELALRDRLEPDNMPGHMSDDASVLAAVRHLSREERRQWLRHLSATVL